MSEYRDQLPGEQRKIYDAAIDAAAQVLADAVAERELLAATYGTRAVAETAWYPGQPLQGKQLVLIAPIAAALGLLMITLKDVVLFHLH